MPANLPREWYLIEEEYRDAKTKEEKIEKLKKLLAATPKHKGTEKLIARIKKQISKLSKESKEKKSSKSSGFKVSGDLLIAIMGMTKTGKSTLLHELTGANVEIGDKPYTTKELATGVCFWKGVSLQFVEIPSFFLPRHLAVARQSDIIILLVRNDEELRELEKILEENNIHAKKLVLNVLFFGSREENAKKDYSQLLDGIIEASQIVRIFTKPPGKQVEERAIVFKQKPTIKDVVERINKAWLKTFKFARVYRGDEKKRVGLDYVLEDGDIVEIHS